MTVCARCRRWKSHVYEIYADSGDSFNASVAGQQQLLCPTCVVDNIVPAFRSSVGRWEFGRVVGVAASQQIGAFRFVFDSIGDCATGQKEEELLIPREPFQAYVTACRERLSTPAGNALPQVATAGGTNNESMVPVPAQRNPFEQHQHERQQYAPVHSASHTSELYNGTTLDSSQDWNYLHTHHDGLSALNTNQAFQSHCASFPVPQRRIPVMRGNEQYAEQRNPRVSIEHNYQERIEEPTVEQATMAGPSTRPKSTPRLWTEDEDRILLRAMIQSPSPHKWPNIASNVPLRTSKQCRERYVNHLVSSVKISEWTPVEDEILCRMYGTLGTKWTIISKELPGRSDNNVKNRFHYLRRQLEKRTATMREHQRSSDFVVASPTREAVMSIAKNDELLPFVADALVHVVKTGSRTLTHDSEAFGPFYVPPGEGSVCVRCSLLVPSSQTGQFVCHKTGWCEACSETSVFLRDDLLRLEHKFRASATAKRVSLGNEDNGITV